MILHPLFFAWSVVLGAAQPAEPAAIAVEPSSLELVVGETAQLRAVVKDARGNVLPGALVIFFSTVRSAVAVTPDGRVEAHEPGELEVVALSPSGSAVTDPELMRSSDPGVRVEIPVKVKPSPLARLEFKELPETLYVGSTAPVGFLGIDSRGRSRDARAEVQSSDPSVVSVAPFGSPFEGSSDAHPSYRRTRPDFFPGDAAAVITAMRAGTATLTATSPEGVRAERTLTVGESPVRSLSLEASVPKARTGDVVHFEAKALDASGGVVAGAPVRYLLEAWPDPSRPDTVGAGAPAQVAPDGRFVAEQAGTYVVLGISGNATAQASVTIEPRNVKREIQLVGHAPVRDRISSDLWVWEGVDGRDYAVHGTWNSDGRAYFYDVTDPAHMERIDEVQVDARTVNDVKVSEDGRICVISREGASNRRNGLVILDVTNPRDVQILAQYDDGMTGGVHNVFIHENHVYAVNNGRRWDVLDIEDPRQPARVARFETKTAGRSVHDVWVRDGIAYQAGNTDALILVDVGGGGMGGSPARPVEMGRMPQLTGWNHSVWPFRSRSAGKFYVVGGDEAHPYNPRVPEEIISWKERIPSRAMGWVHFIEFDDLDAPREVARYQIPEAGPHNYWIDWEREVMYVAYFNAGLRVVDVSGELMGDLYRQGREIAKFYSDDSEGYVPNAPFVWGPQPHKGTIFFSDFHSGLWAVRLVPPLEEDAQKTSSSPAPHAGRVDFRPRKESVP